MKAAVLRSHAPIEVRPLVLEEVPRPEPGRRHVLVRVECCGVCHTDLHTVEGEITPPHLPIIPGHQVVGIVEELGEGATRFGIGDRVGLAWLAQTCGGCEYCRRGDENLCEKALFHGFHLDGGYAEYVRAHEDFVYPIPDGFPSEQAAPLLCAGIIGYRALKQADAGPGKRVGLYGFGASAHVAIQILDYWGAHAYVFSRSESHRRLARDLGAVWTGRAEDDPPEKLDSAIIFAPAGPLTLEALRALDKGGTLALAGIYMTPIPEIDYEKHLYDERTVRSVTASTREDGRELLELAAEIPIRTKTIGFPLETANDVLAALKAGEIDGAAVLKVWEKIVSPLDVIFPDGPPEET
jgi:propanol-preferring alcohol dehydrogenase